MRFVKHGSQLLPSTYLLKEKGNSPLPKFVSMQPGCSTLAVTFALSACITSINGPIHELALKHEVFMLFNSNKVLQ